MIAEPRGLGMKCLLVTLLLASGVAGCSNPPDHRPTQGAKAANLAVRTIKVTDHELLLEVHIYPRRALGEAHLTVSGKGIRVSPRVFNFDQLAPPPSPDASRSPPNPPPLPRTIIRTFHINATTQPPPELKVKLWWHNGSTSTLVPWPQQHS